MSRGRFRGPILTLALLLATGCTTRLTPAPEPAVPVPVFLLDHGRHASLVLPREDGGTVRYSYGDWRYYARGITGFRSGAAAVLWPTDAGLGRRELEAPPLEADIRLALQVEVDTVLVLRVEQERATLLRTRLDSLHAAGRKRAFLYNAAYDLEFSHHSRRYWLGHNSNQVLAAWLRELGVETRGPALLSTWRVESATGGAPPR